MSDELLRLKSKDGLGLEVKRFEGGGRTPAVCIPGLTRNRRDFDAFAAQLSRAGRDVYALSLRGRGGSDYDPNYENYNPLVYCDDVLNTLDQLDIPQAVLVGTSLGGIVAMMTNMLAPERVAAAILNDIGAELAPEGLTRIAAYVGGGENAAAADLDEAAAQIRAVNEIAFPGRDEAFWRRFALNTFRETSDGRWILDYDPLVGKALADADNPIDLWPAFTSLKNTPTLLIRGALSDLLTPEIVDKMRAVHPALAVCEVPGVGHAPLLTEAEAIAAISRFLDASDYPALVDE